MAGLNKQFETIQSLNTQVYALSVDAPPVSQAVMEEMKLAFDLLCDVDKTVIDLYHVHNKKERGGIAYPAIFIITPKGKICYRSLDRTAQRVNLSEVIDFLEKLQEVPDHQRPASVKKDWVVPMPAEVQQIMRNMLLRGNLDDWKHYGAVSMKFLKMLTKPLKK